MSYRQDVRWAQLMGRLRREEEQEERERAAHRRALLPQPGTRVRLLGTTDIHTRLEPGAEGTVSLVDAMGTVHVNWDSGSNLGLVFGEDRWEVIS